MHLTFHSDSGHGWLAVPLAELSRLGVRPTVYSYRDNDCAYLEEDCDRPAFEAAAAEQGIGLTFGYEHHDGDCFVRALRSF